MSLGFLLLFTGLTISGVAIYYSVIGMAAIFAAAPIPIYIMGTTLEIAKLVGASWLKAYWTKAPGFIKTYMMIAILVLMMITSMGIFGFLSKAHLDQNLVGGDVVDKVAILDEKIKTQRDNIEVARKALVQMDQSVDQTMARSTSEKGASRAFDIRKSQSKERNSIRSEIELAQKEIARLNEERAPIAKDLRKIEAEVGPIKYIAALLYGDNPSQNILEKAVTYVIIMIVIVFDPLAVVMLIAAQMTFTWKKEQPSAKIDPIIEIPNKIVNITKFDLESFKPASVDEQLTEVPTESLEIESIDIKNDDNIVISENITGTYVSDFGIKPIDHLYQEYAKDHFEGLAVDPIKEPDLARFIEKSKVKARFNNYTAEQLEYFARRINELRHT